MNEILKWNENTLSPFITFGEKAAGTELLLLLIILSL